jgi:hypothetical protein
MQIFKKSENHACMNKQIFENLYGEEQSALSQHLS